ncbi:hypothetical protein F4677DRAFT_428361 [Hypoxylon crocopeplum]|nr:hypothetical protein F4677DRAFT_428361 [Hypoxylon crocopeplum]
MRIPARGCPWRKRRRRRRLVLSFFNFSLCDDVICRLLKIYGCLPSHLDQWDIISPDLDRHFSDFLVRAHQPNHGISKCWDFLGIAQFAER